jgi:hypothetical protein
MRIETVNRSIEEIEFEARLLREFSSFVNREFVFCRETPVREYLVAHYSSEDLKGLFETYNAYIEKYLELIVKGIVEDCRALELYRKPISLRLLKSLIERRINILQIEKAHKRGPKKRKESKSAYRRMSNLSIENSPQTRGGIGPRGAGALTGRGPVRAGDLYEGKAT